MSSRKFEYGLRMIRAGIPCSMLLGYGDKKDCPTFWSLLKRGWYMDSFSLGEDPTEEYVQRISFIG